MHARMQQMAPLPRARSGAPASERGSACRARYRSSPERASSCVTSSTNASDCASAVSAARTRSRGGCVAAAPPAAAAGAAAGGPAGAGDGIASDELPALARDFSVNLVFFLLHQTGCYTHGLWSGVGSDKSMTRA